MNKGSGRREIGLNSKSHLKLSLKSVFSKDISDAELDSAVDLFKSIEGSIRGRIAGDIDDPVFCYLFLKGLHDDFEKTEQGWHVEIGTLFGGSLILSLKAFEQIKGKAKVACIDPLDGYYMADPVRRSKVDRGSNEPVCKEVLSENLAKFNYSIGSDVDLIQSYSTDEQAISFFRGKKIVSLFIDGDHTYGGIENDWTKFAPQVVDGGFVIIDNYNDHAWPGVSQFVHDKVLWDEEWTPVVVLNRTIVFKKQRTECQPARLMIHGHYLRTFETLIPDFERNRRDLNKDKATINAKIQKLQSEFDQERAINSQLKANLNCTLESKAKRLMSRIGIQVGSS